MPPLADEDEGIDESVDKIIRYLELKGLAPAAADGGISSEEEEQIKGRLKSLNFID